MDLLRIGQFISKKRKEHNLTQNELAERLNITDRAVSKWECGRSLPDSSIMLNLCEILEISLNELLLGEELEMEKANKENEANLLAMIKQKEESDKRLLKIEIIFEIIVILFFFGVLAIVLVMNKYYGLTDWITYLIIGIDVLLLLVSLPFVLLIEQKAGYYECQNCHKRYVPKFVAVFFAPHINRSRLMKCPHCKKWSYHKKVISEK